MAAARDVLRIGHNQREEFLAGESVADSSCARNSVAERRRNAFGHTVGRQTCRGALHCVTRRRAARALATRNRDADMQSAFPELLLLTRADPGLSTVDK